MNEWDEQERRKREREQLEASLYRNRSRLHGSGLTEDEQEERDFRQQFPQFNKVFTSTDAKYRIVEEFRATKILMVSCSGIVNDGSSKSWLDKLCSDSLPVDD